MALDRFQVPWATRSTESSPTDPEPIVAGGWAAGADQVEKAQKQPKTRNATAGLARLPVTAKRYRKPKKIPQNFPRAAGSGGLKMRIANHPFQVSRSHREATGTKCALMHGMSLQRPPQKGPDLRAGRLRSVGTQLFPNPNRRPPPNSSPFTSTG